MSQKLQIEARDTIWKYLWIDTRRWAFGDAVNSLEYAWDQKQLARLSEIADEIGEDRVKDIWADVRADIRRTMAEDALAVVPEEVVNSWLADSVSDDCGEEFREGLGTVWLKRMHEQANAQGPTPSIVAVL